MGINMIAQPLKLEELKNRRLTLNLSVKFQIVFIRLLYGKGAFK